jgi:flagellin
MSFGPIPGVSPYRSILALNRTTSLLSRSLERLSTGYRVNRAADDPAGLAVATHFSVQANSGEQAIRNINTGISLIQTGEAAMDEVGNLLDRMRELAVQSSSETLTSTQRTQIDDEFDELNAEINRLSKATEFNDIALASGVNADVDVFVGVDGTTADTVTVELGDVRPAALGLSSTDLSTASAASDAISDIDDAIDTVNGYRSDYGSAQNRLDSASGYMTNYVDAMRSAHSGIMDTDFAFEMAETSRLQILQAAGVAALVQARSMNESLLGLLAT